MRITKRGRVLALPLAMIEAFTLAAACSDTGILAGGAVLGGISMLIGWALREDERSMRKDDGPKSSD